MTDRDERIENYYHWSAWDLAERIVDLEDEKKAQELDPSRLESALRMYIAELDYDKHKYIRSPEDGGPDRYPEEVQFFLRCWDVAGKG